MVTEPVPIMPRSGAAAIHMIDYPRFGFRDRTMIAAARYLAKPALSLVSDARKIRFLLASPARLLGRPPAGTEVSPEQDGSLFVIPAGVPRDAPCLVYIHGGGFVAGSPWTHLRLAGHLAARAGLTVYLPRYRLAPEYPCPAARDDIRAAYAALINRGIHPAAICGDSAGGNLALLLLVHIREQGWPMPRAAGLFSPVGTLADDISARMAAAPDEMLFPEARLHDIARDYLAGQNPNDPEVSPILADLSGLPPGLVQASSVEALAEDARRLARASGGFQVEFWPGLPHVLQFFVGRAPVADTAVDRMAAFLRARI